MIEAVVLDLYGTLVRMGRDTKPYLRLARSARPEDPAAVPRASLVTDAPDLAALAAALGFSPPEDLATLEEDVRRDVAAVDVFEDVIGPLTELRAMGLTLGLISNLASPYRAPFLRHGLDRFRGSAIFSCDVGRCKPDPQIYLTMAAELGLPPAKILMVGDRRRADFDGPRAVCMEAIPLSRGVGTPGPDEVGGLRELPRRVRQGRA